MIQVGLFGEDDAHRLLLRPLIERIASEESVPVEVHTRNATGGIPRVLGELSRYARDLETGVEGFLQVLVVAIDANCVGRNARTASIVDKVGDLYPGVLVPAVPDPHIEKWYLADPQAVPRVLGERGTAVVPSMKCERSRYKTALVDAFSKYNVTPPLGGIEYGEDIVREMDFGVAARHDDLERFVDEFRRSVRVVSA